MIQLVLIIALVAAGFAAIAKAKIQVTASRTLEATGARVVGAGLLASAGLSFLPGDHGLLVMVGGAVVCTIVAYAMASEHPQAEEVPSDQVSSEEVPT